MSRQIWCADCGEEQNKLDGTRLVLDRVPAQDGDPAEPAEYERVVWGRARAPNPETHFIGVNEARLPLPPHYICDGCNASINPGDRCMTWTIWNELMVEPPAWEKEFLE